MKLLSMSDLKAFDYVKTRKNVEDYLKDLNIIKYKYRNVLPPSLALNLFDIKVQSSGNSKSQIEAYIEKKDEYERLYKDKLDEINQLVDDMTLYEKRFFIDHFIHDVKMDDFEKQFRCGKKLVTHIKQSSVIKFALALDIVVYK